MSAWVKSSHSQGGNCVEVEHWVKSSHSTCNGHCVEAAFAKSSHSAEGCCVEVGAAGDGVHVRDSKDRAGPVLSFTAAEWDAFIAGVKDGEFDRA